MGEGEGPRTRCGAQLRLGPSLAMLAPHPPQAAQVALIKITLAQDRKLEPPTPCPQIQMQMTALAPCQWEEPSYMSGPLLSLATCRHPNSNPCLTSGLPKSFARSS